MTNQSIIAVPPDLSDQTVLRRFLSLLVERVDVAIGNRDSDTFLDAQSELLASIASAKEAIETATTELDEATQQLDELRTTTIEELSTAIIDNTNSIANLTSLSSLAAFTACTIEFTVDVSDEPDILRSFNIAAGVRISAGVYEFDLTTTSYKGADLLTASYGTFSHVVAPTLTTELYSIAGEVVSTSKFRIKVYGMTKALLSDSVVATPYDLEIGDTVVAVYTYKLPGAIVPL